MTNFMEAPGLHTPWGHVGNYTTYITIMFLVTKCVAVARYEPVFGHNSSHGLCGPFNTSFDLLPGGKMELSNTPSLGDF